MGHNSCTANNVQAQDHPAMEFAAAAFRACSTISLNSLVPFRYESLSEVDVQLLQHTVMNTVAAVACYSAQHSKHVGALSSHCHIFITFGCNGQTRVPLHLLQYECLLLDVTLKLHEPLL